MFWSQIKKWAFENWKTTVAGLILGLAGILKGYGIVVEDGTVNWVIAHVVPVATLFLGFFARDGK